ncbi:MAG: glycoside hydrolase family 15 protein, partial [Terriglobus sp.]
QAYGARALDAALLRIPLVGILPANDPRVLGTVEAIQKKLQKGDLVLRYNAESDDGFPPGEGAFLACSFWMVGVLYLVGRQDEARAMFERLLKLRNPLGLIAEEYDPGEMRQVGNFPQAFSHLTMVHAAVILSGGKGPWTEAVESKERC